MKKHKILLVDDEKNIIQSLVRLLRKEDYQLLTAASGMEGLDILKTEPVSLIVSDQRMPGMNGVEFLQQVKKLYPTTIRIILSGYTEINSIVSAINEGHVYKFITKPWNDEEIKLTIKHSLDQYILKNENKNLLTTIQKYNQDLEKKIDERTQDIRTKNQTLLLSQAILENLPMGVIGIGDDGNISLINNAGNEIFFSGQNSILGLQFSEIFPPEVADLVTKTIKTGIFQEPAGTKINGREYFIESSPICDDTDQKCVILIVVKNW